MHIISAKPYPFVKRTPSSMDFIQAVAATDDAAVLSDVVQSECALKMFTIRFRVTSCRTAIVSVGSGGGGHMSFIYV